MVYIKYRLWKIVKSRKRKESEIFFRDANFSHQNLDPRNFCLNGMPVLFPAENLISVETFHDILSLPGGLDDVSMTAIGRSCPNLTDLNISWCKHVTDDGVICFMERVPHLQVRADFLPRELLNFNLGLSSKWWFEVLPMLHPFTRVCFIYILTI